MKNRLILLSNRLLLGILLIMRCGQVCGMRWLYVWPFVRSFVEPLATNCAWRIYQSKQTKSKRTEREKKNHDVHWQQHTLRHNQWIQMIPDDFSFLINSYSTFVWLKLLTQTHGNFYISIHKFYTAHSFEPGRFFSFFFDEL